MARIITLITDFLTTDGYMGAVYGVLKSINPDVEIITIASSIPPADLRKAARAILNSYRFYPTGTVHMVVVDPTVGAKRRPILVVDSRYYYVGPDNGVLSPVFTFDDEFECYHIANPKYKLAADSHTFHGRDLFAPVAAYLTLGVPPSEFGPRIDDPVTLEDRPPETFGRETVGRVVDIDAFGNLVTNIPAELLQADSTIIIAGGQIHGLSLSYVDVPEKQPLAYIGSTGFLEIAINSGHAANY